MAVYKSGTGTSGRVCGDSGTWGRETRDLRTSSMGRGDAGTSNTGTQGTRDVNKKSKLNAISVTFLVNMFGEGNSPCPP